MGFGVIIKILLNYRSSKFYEGLRTTSIISVVEMEGVLVKYCTSPVSYTHLTLPTNREV